MTIMLSSFVHVLEDTRLNTVFSKHLLHLITENIRYLLMKLLVDFVTVIWLTRHSY